MRPGKPLMAGRLHGVPMLGLPGNPVSAIVCGHLFLLPMVRAMLGDPAPLPGAAQARLTVDLPANGPRAHYMRARLIAGDGLPRHHALRPAGLGAAVDPGRGERAADPAGRRAAPGAGSDGRLPAALSRGKFLTQTGNTGRTLREHIAPQTEAARC